MSSEEEVLVVSLATQCGFRAGHGCIDMIFVAHTHTHTHTHTHCTHTNIHIIIMYLHTISTAHKIIHNSKPLP